MANKDKKAIKVFFIAFAISFVILMCVFLMFFITGTDANKEANANNTDVPYYNDYKPVQEENLSILIIGCDRTESEPTLFLFVQYNAVDSQIEMQLLDPETHITVGDRIDTLKGHYDYASIRGGVNAAKEYLNCNIDRYIRINAKGIANMVDYLGGVQYEFKQSIRCRAIDFTGGKQTLDGRRLSAILLDETATEIKVDVVSAYINQHFNKNLSDSFGKYITALFYNVETNLTQYDFAIRQKGFMNALDKSTIGIKIN